MNYPISSIEINGFRGIEKFKIEKSSRINVFLGKNNVGKTSILEAIFLLTGMSNPILPNLVNAIREGRVLSMEDLGWLFYNGKTDRPISILDGVSRAVQINPILGLEKGDGSTPIYSVSGLKIKGLRLNFSYRGIEYEESFYTGEEELTHKKSSYQEKIRSCFLPSNNIRANLSSNIEEIIQKNKKNRLVDIIKSFNGEVVNIEFINDRVFVQLSDIDKLIPISFIGDGLQHFIGICAAVINPENKVVLIDEIDNGLHYTVLKQLWKSLIELSIENDTQLFITTHNEEVLRTLAMVLEEDNDAIDLSVFSIQMTERAGLKAYKYPPQALRGAIEKGIEIR